MRRECLLFICLLWVVSLFSQPEETMLAHLKTGATIEIDWVQQHYLPDSGSIAREYPLFPDQLKDGEGEMHARLRLQKLNNNRIKVWVAYIFSLQYPQRIPLDPSKGIYAEGLPEKALVYPQIEDTRYHFDALSTMPEFYKNLSKKPLIFTIDEGIINKEWFSILEEATENTSSYFNAHHLEMFLKDLITTRFVEKVGYRKTIQYQTPNSLAQHYYKLILPPQKTVISGIIKNPISNSITLNYQNHESWVKRSWNGLDIDLDSTGHFSFEVSIQEPTNLRLSQSFFPLPIYAEPGDSIKIMMDANGIYRRTKFSGDNAVNNQVLLDFYHHIRGDTIMMITPDFSIVNKSQAEHLGEVQQRERKELHYLFSHKDKVSSNFYSFLDRTIRFSNANRLWYNASFFKRRPDVQLMTDYVAHCQKLSKLLFRLPAIKNYDFNINMYLNFQRERLKGVFLDQPLTLRSLPAFDFYQPLLTPDNNYRHGTLLLFLNREKNSTTAFKQFYERLEEGCSQRGQQASLKDYLEPVKPQDLPANSRRFKMLPVGEPAPFWEFPILDGQKLSLNNFLGKHLLLHIGLEQNLPLALEDINEIKAITNRSIEVVSIVAREPGKAIKENNSNVIYLPHEEMQILRDSYRIENNANNYFIIAPDGKVLSNPLFTSTFNYLKATVTNLPLEKEAFELPPTFWKYLGILSLMLLAIVALYTQRKRTLAKREQQKRQLVELELKGIRAQMNPHFLFNALSSIQNLIRKKEDLAADRYLTQFAGLVRKILRNSEHEFITLEEEMAAIKQYCSLEALRTPFDYELTIADDIDAFNTYIPGMLIQPLVENAILHGLMPKQGEKNLWITIQPAPEGLACTIMDNGIGIHQAQSQRQRHKAHQKSFGVTLIRQRLGLLLNQSKTTFLTIQDRSELTPPDTGTIVKLLIPTEK